MQIKRRNKGKVKKKKKQRRRNNMSFTFNVYENHKDIVSIEPNYQKENVDVNLSVLRIKNFFDNHPGFSLQVYQERFEGYKHQEFIQTSKHKLSVYCDGMSQDIWTKLINLYTTGVYINSENIDFPYNSYFLLVDHKIGMIVYYSYGTNHIKKESNFIDFDIDDTTHIVEYRFKWVLDIEDSISPESRNKWSLMELMQNSILNKPKLESFIKNVVHPYRYHCIHVNTEEKTNYMYVISAYVNQLLSNIYDRTKLNEYAQDNNKKIKPPILYIYNDLPSEDYYEYIDKLIVRVSNQMYIKYKEACGLEKTHLELSSWMNKALLVGKEQKYNKLNILTIPPNIEYPKNNCLNLTEDEKKMIPEDRQWAYIP